MRFVRVVFTAAAVVSALAIAFSATPTAQAPTSDAEFATLMKSVGATNGSLRKNIEGQAADAIAADARKMADLMKNNMVFWTARKNQEAADWAKGAMEAAMSIEKAAGAKDMATVSGGAKALGGSCQTCHMKNRDKAPDGTYMIKKG